MTSSDDVLIVNLLFIGREREARLVADQLQRDAIEATFRVAADRDSVLRALQETHWSAVIADETLPDWSSFDALKLVHDREPNLPFVMLSGTTGEERAVDAIRGGASDYIMKDRLGRLAPTLRRELREPATSAEEGLRRHALQQSAVANLGHSALSNASLDELFRYAASFIHDVLRVDFCEVTKKQGDDRFVMVAGFGWEPGTEDELRGPSSLAALTIRERSPVITRDMTADERIEPSPFMQRHGVRGGATVPIGAGGEPWGLIGAYSRSERTLTESDVDFLRTVATILGQSIERVRADVELRFRAAQQSAIAELGQLAISSVDQTTLDRACVLAQHGLRAEHALLHERSGDDLVVRAGHLWRHDLRAVTPIGGESQSAMSASTREPVVVRDYVTDERFPRAIRDAAAAANVRSGISVPLAGSHMFLGVLSAYAGTARAYTAADVHFMQSLANTLAEAMEREQATRALVASEERYRSVVEGASEIIFDVDRNGVICALNRAFETITGHPRSSFIGRPFGDLFDGDDARLSSQLFTLAEGQSFNWEAATQRADGTSLLLDVTWIPKVEEGAVTSMHGFARDITESRRIERERQQLEAKLEQANRLSSLGRLAATVAHEFNNVLMGIAPFIEVIRRTTSRERIESSLGQMSLSVARGKRITSEILRFTQPAEPSRTRIDVGEWLRAIAAEARSLVPASCTLDVASEEGLAIDGDVNQLHQMLTNLILNAVDAMPSGGALTIRASRELPGATFRFGTLDRPERFIHLSVSDTGTGMSVETRRHIFEPLFTTKKSGTGLGLPLAHQIVARHGGEIFVETLLGAGSTFHIFVPAFDKAAARPAEPPPRAATRAEPRRRRVLLVEDDAAVAAGIVSLLEMEGLTVDIIDTGAAAIEVIKANPPDVVVLDVGLPDMEGTAVYDAIAGTHPDLPVIFSTGHADESRLEEYLAKPTVSYLLKPYDAAALLAAIDEVT